MPIKDVFLPLVGQPRGPALAAIATCVAVAADLGARITALALEEDVFARPTVISPGDLDSAEASGSREVSDVQQLLNAFTNAASRANIRAQSRSGKVPADQIASILAEHARFSDLTLVPVRPHDSQTEHIIETLLFESGRPLPRGRSATRCPFFRLLHPSGWSRWRTTRPMRSCNPEPLSSTI